MGTATTQRQVLEAQDSPIIKRFAAEYQEYNGMSDQRRGQQRNVLRQLEVQCGGDLLSATPDDLRRYLASLIAQGQHPNTVERKRRMALPFYTWAFSVELIDGDRFMRLTSVPAPNGAGRGVPRPYSAAELAELYEALDRRWPHVDPKWWPRVARGTSRFKRVASGVMRCQMECIIALALHGGLRRNEIFSLSPDDVATENAYVLVRQRALVPNGKDRMREVPFTSGLREAVERWLAMRELLGVPHDSLWIVASTYVPKGTSLNPMGVARFNELMEALGRREDGSYWLMHRLRHTSATNWLRAGVPIELVSRYLGHSNISQTLGYAELVREDIAVAMSSNEDRFNQLIGTATTNGGT